MENNEKLSMPLDEIIKKNKGSRQQSSSSPSKRSKPFKTRKESFKNGSRPSHKIFVGNLSYKTSWQDLKDSMKSYGHVEYADIFTDGRGRSKGCGIVEFSTAQEARKAMEKANETELDGRTIFIKEDQDGGSRDRGQYKQKNEYRRERSRSRSFEKRGRRTTNSRRTSGNENMEGYHLRVLNVPFNTSWQDLKDKFRKFGSVLHVEIEKKLGTTEAIVIFEEKQDAMNAHKKMDNSIYEGNRITVEFA